MMLTYEPTMDEVMTPNPVPIAGSASLSEAHDLMKALGVRHLPVTINSVVEGIISEPDLQHFLSFGHHYQADDDLTLEDICTRRIHVADVNDPLGSVLRIMIKDHLDALVLLRNGELAGIFTESDACRILAKHIGFAV